MIDTLIFDLSEVQMTGLVGVEERLYRILKLPKSEILPKLRGPNLALLFNGKITEDEYLSRVIDKNKWPIKSSVLKNLIRDNFREIEGMRELVESLYKNGYKLGLLSTHGKEWVDYISKKFNHHRPFKEVSYSFESGISKPDKRAYLEILNKLRSNPENSIFIDDNQANIVAAKEIGMKVILFKDANKLKKKLIAFGVVI